MNSTRLGTALALALTFFSAPALGASTQQQLSDLDRRGWIGFTFDDNGQPQIEVAEVMPGAPAEKAGLRAGDRITSWNGRSDVATAVRERPLEIGDTVRLRISRAGEPEREVTVIAARRPPNAELLARQPRRIFLQERLENLPDSIWRAFGNGTIRIITPDSAFAGFGTGSLGVALALGRNAVAGAELADITPGLASYFGTDQGVLVLRVAPNTPAGRAGLQDGDVILRAGGQSVSDIAELRWAMSRPGIRDVELEVLRKGERLTLTLGR